MKVKKYVKRPIVIEALQYNENNRRELLEFTENKAFFIDRNGTTELIILTLGGVMLAAPGSYIVRGPKGEFYPVRKDIFKEIYEEVADD